MTKLDAILLEMGLRALKLLPPEMAREFGLWLLGPYFATRKVVTFPYYAAMICFGLLALAFARSLLWMIERFDRWRIGAMYRIEARHFGALEPKEENAKR